MVVLALSISNFSVPGFLGKYFLFRVKICKYTSGRKRRLQNAVLVREKLFHLFKSPSSLPGLLLGFPSFVVTTLSSFTVLPMATIMNWFQSKLNVSNNNSSETSSRN